MSNSSKSPRVDPETLRPTLTPDAETLRPCAEPSASPEYTHLRPLSGAAAADDASEVTYERLSTEFADQMTPEIHLRIVLEVLRALQPVHTNLLRPPPQRCHGTLNPGCILVNAEGTVSLFWQPMVKPNERQRPYLAPEVRRGSDPDQQADVYSVGVILYEALTGCRLGTTVPEKSHPTLASWTEPLLDIAIEAMYVTPSRRWASALSFAEGILALAKSRVAARAELCEVLREALATPRAPSLAVSGRVSSGISIAHSGAPSAALTSLSGEVFAVSQHLDSISAGPHPAQGPHSGMWFSARRTPMFTWLSLSAAVVLSSLLVGFWLGRASPEVPVVMPAPEAHDPAPTAAPQRAASLTHESPNDSQPGNAVGTAEPLVFDEPETPGDSERQPARAAKPALAPSAGPTKKTAKPTARGDKSESAAAPSPTLRPPSAAKDIPLKDYNPEGI